ncbi:MAG: hypothetical protein D6725_16470 [Planctomycetota bacterium]|nr:MAG: hypothetical protein D6725_16470 [Planctomycetota bacterium]
MGRCDPEKQAMDGPLKATRQILAVATVLTVLLGVAQLTVAPHRSSSRGVGHHRDTAPGPAGGRAPRHATAAHATPRRDAGRPVPANAHTRASRPPVSSLEAITEADARSAPPDGRPTTRRRLPPPTRGTAAEHHHTRRADEESSRTASHHVHDHDAPDVIAPSPDARTAQTGSGAPRPAASAPLSAPAPQPPRTAAGRAHAGSDATPGKPSAEAIRAERRIVFRPLPATNGTETVRPASERSSEPTSHEDRVPERETANPVPPPQVLRPPAAPHDPADANAPSSQRLSAHSNPDGLEFRLAQLERKLQTISERLPERRDETSDLRQRLEHLERLAQLDQLQKQIERLLEQRQKAAAGPNGDGGPTPDSSPSDSDASRTTDGSPADESPRVVTTAPRSGDTFTIHTAEETPLSDVLQQLSELAGTNILPSLAAQKLRVTLHLKNVTLQQALEVLAENYDLEVMPHGDFVYVRTRQEAEQARQRQRKIVTRVFRLNYISAQDVQQVIQPLITEKVGRITTTTPAQVGIQQDESNAGGNALAQLDTIIVMDYEDIVEEIARVIAELDKPPLQVVIEAKILSVQLDDSLKYGINFALLSGSGDDLFIGGNGLELQNSSGIPALAISPSISPSGSFVSDIGGLKYGLIRGDASLFIRAVEQISDTSLIAAPQLRVLNKQRAELLIGQRIAYKTLTFNGTQTVENVNFLDVGTRLILRPFASEDGLVRLEIHPKKSSGTVSDGLPEERTTQVTTNVMVREGTTVVIGGLIEEQISDSDDRIPLLGSLPGVGALFRNKEEAVTRNELIVLLTPRIVREPEAVLEGEQFNEEHERRQESFRNSLTPFNRRNLARLETERAQHYYDTGNLLKARTHIQKALKYSPNDPHARRLRDQIETDLGQRFRNLLFWPSGLKRHPTHWPEPAGEQNTDGKASAEPSAGSAPDTSPGFTLELSPTLSAPPRSPATAPLESSPSGTGGASEHRSDSGRPATPRTLPDDGRPTPDPSDEPPGEPPAPAPPLRPLHDRTPAARPSRPAEKTASGTPLQRMSYTPAALPGAPAVPAGSVTADDTPKASTESTRQPLLHGSGAFPPSVLSRRTVAPGALLPTLPPPPSLSEITPTIPLPGIPAGANPPSQRSRPAAGRSKTTFRRVKRGGRGLR